MLLRDRVGAEAAAYLEELVRRVEKAVGDRLVGIWVIGSAALGDFEPRRSDLDVQAIAMEELPPVQLTALAAELAHDVLPCPARGLEFVLYARKGLTDSRGPGFQLNFNTGVDMATHLELDARADPRFWFVIDVAIAREHGVSLVGPPAASVWPELPRPAIAGALSEALTWYANRDPVQTFLAACRAWAWAVEGFWLSKRDAAEWARGRIPDASVDVALAARGRGSGDHLDGARLASVLALSRAALEDAAR
jgi:hypothetical protein